MVTVLLQRLSHGAGLPLPAYETAGAAGLDLRAAIGEPVMLAPGARTLVPTGLAMQLPAGFEGQVRPRSGLALRHGVTVLNAPGTVDSDIHTTRFGKLNSFIWLACDAPRFKRQRGAAG